MTTEAFTLRSEGQAKVIAGGLIGLAIGAAAALIALKFMRLGHGSYLPAAILFPYSMAISVPLGRIAWPLIALALLQFPVYGFLIGANRSRMGLVAVVHLVCAVAACVLVLTSESFR